MLMLPLTSIQVETKLTPLFLIAWTSVLRSVNPKLRLVSL